MVFWFIIIALAILLFIRSWKGTIAKKAADNAREADRKELLSRLKSIDKNLSKIRSSLKESGKEEEEKNEGEHEGKNKKKTESVQPSEKETV